jgi:hypothetical protein
VFVFVGSMDRHDPLSRESCQPHFVPFRVEDPGMSRMSEFARRSGVWVDLREWHESLLERRLTADPSRGRYIPPRRIGERTEPYSVVRVFGAGS